MCQSTISTGVSDPSFEKLRHRHYNADVTEIKKLHDELMILRVRHDSSRLTFEAGQYTVLGLGRWEKSIDDPRLPTSEQRQKLIKRAYSISCRLIDDRGRLTQADATPELEFYITLVRQTKKPPGLTPRLFNLASGDRLFMSTRSFGLYTLREIDPDDQVIFAGTGTGEAPHNAMIAALLGHRHRGPIACLTCVRYRKDLGYLKAHRLLEQRFSNYRYVSLTTREPENLDRTNPGFIGKRYLQDVFEADDFFALTNCRLAPEGTHVFLCGGPDMIGVSRHASDSLIRKPQTRGMVQVLEKLGFRVDQPKVSGNIHFEKYW